MASVDLDTPPTHDVQAHVATNKPTSPPEQQLLARVCCQQQVQPFLKHFAEIEHLNVGLSSADNTARAELARGVGKQFDPQLVPIFIRAIDEWEANQVPASAAGPAKAAE
ncbi:MAG: hypothetical protein M3R24_08665 [Chloroflexota bacterium]|nr:hypothetical protein [Chloroflexota bacterium]